MKKTIQISIVVVLVALLVFGWYQVLSFYNRPLAEPMNVQLPEQMPEQQEGVEVVAGGENTPQKKVICGQTGVIHILFIGASQPETPSPFGAESVRLIKVDYDKKKVTIVAFPRDLLLKTEGYTEFSTTLTRLGSVYSYGKESTQGEEQNRVTQATSLVAQVLYDNFSYPIDKKNYFYFTVQVNEMGKMIDVIGGLDVNLPEAFTNERNITFPAGKQTLNGKLAIEFVNSLHPGGDQARLKRQNILAQALQEKLLSPEILAKVPELYKQFDKVITTDLSPEQIESLACTAKEIPHSDISFKEINVENGLVTASKDGSLIPDVEKIKTALKDWFGE